MSLTPIALEIDQGDDEVLELTIKTKTGDAANLTGCTLNFAIRTSAALDPILAKSTTGGAGIEITAPATDGLATIAISAADTTALDPKYMGRTLRWELEVIDTTVKTTTLAKGTIVINRDLVSV